MADNKPTKQQAKPAARQIAAPQSAKPLSTSDSGFLQLSPAKQQEVISAELFGTAERMDYNYTEYGKKCALNGIVAAQVYLRNAGKSFQDINLPLFVLSLHNLAVTELNCATLPAEAFCDMRGNVLAFRPQGVGNERLVRKFGVGIKPETGLHKCWVIHEGDEFTLPQFDGLDIVPPKWIPKGVSGKVIMVVYPVEKANGDVEWLMADRASVINNVVAQIRQNALYAFVKRDQAGSVIYYKGKPQIDAAARDAFYDRINKLAEQAAGDLDKFLAYPEVLKYVNPTYTSFGSREAMIERKMKNNALKQYPKDYESSIVAQAVSDMNEDYDESLNESPASIEERRTVVEKVEEETKAPPTGEQVPDFSIDESTGEVIASEEPSRDSSPGPNQKPAEEPKGGYDDLV